MMTGERMERWPFVSRMAGTSRGLMRCAAADLGGRAGVAGVAGVAGNEGGNREGEGRKGRGGRR